MTTDMEKIQEMEPSLKYIITNFSNLSFKNGF
jgi:hypothetical protein